MKGVFFFVIFTVACALKVMTVPIQDYECKALSQSIRNDFVVAISKTEPWKQQWDAKLFKWFGDAFKTYLKDFKDAPPVITTDVGYTLFRMDSTNKTGGATFTDESQLVISMVLFLNDDVAGAKWIFSHQKVAEDPFCGKLLVFPSSFTHSYEIEQVKLGSSYFIRTWFK